MAYCNDVGGLHGFGPIDLGAQQEEPFESVWEGELFMLVLTLAGAGTITRDQLRHAVERLPPSEYYAMSYYERWLVAAEQLLSEKGLL